MKNFGWYANGLAFALMVMVGFAATAHAQTPVTNYPYMQGFENQPPYAEAELRAVASGTFPTNSAGAGGVPGSGSRNESGNNVCRVIQSINNASPQAGNWFLDMTGDGVSYIDIYFDLQGVTTQDPVTLEFYWSDSNSSEFYAQDGCYLSTNGGQSWELILFVMNTAQVGNDTWNRASVDVSNLMAARNLSYTSNTVIRWQMTDSLDSERMLIDSITLTVPIPKLTADASAGTAASVYSNDQGAGNAGTEAGSFTLQSNSSGPITINSLDLTASGTGDDSTAFSDVAIYRDDDGSDSYTSGDVLIANQSGFASDNGTLPMTFSGNEADFPASTTRTYFVVTKLSGAAAPGDTFNFTIDDITVTGGNKDGVPTTTMTGLVIDNAVFNVDDVDTGPAQTAYLSTTGNVAQTFTIAYPAGPSDKPDSISVTATGTADDAADVANVELWYDADLDGNFDSVGDTLVDSGTYIVDDATITFSLASQPDFVSGETRRFFVIYDLSSSGTEGETLKCYVSALGASAYGGVSMGLPAPSMAGSNGLEVGANILQAVFNGPSAAMTVDAESMVGSDGELLYDFTLNTIGGTAWTVNSMTFNASGTGNANSAFSALRLYQDDGNGVWDGSGTEMLEGSVTGFTAGAATLMLTNTTVAGNNSVRYYLIGVLGGSATSGDTFNANLESIAYVPPAGGQVWDVPGQASTALVIDQPTLTVSNQNLQPQSQIHVAGEEASYPVAAFAMTTVNNSVDISSVVLTMGGTADWLSDVDPVNGVQVYLDNGNSIFDDNLDPLLFETAGAQQVTVNFSPALTIPRGGIRALWIVLKLTESAGSGQATTPETFSVSIAAASDVSANSMVVLGTPAPSAELLSAIDFRVDSFSPETGLPIGGDDITITGSGFVAPITVTIGGEVCGGTAVIVDGTEITGLTVPEGMGLDQPIVISTAYVSMQEISQTYDFVSPKKGGGGGGGCALDSQGGGAWAWLLLLLIGLPIARKVSVRE